MLEFLIRVLRFTFYLPQLCGRGRSRSQKSYFFISLMITCMSAVEILPSPLRS